MHDLITAEKLLKFLVESDYNEDSFVQIVKPKVVERVFGYKPDYYFIPVHYEVTLRVIYRSAFNGPMHSCYMKKYPDLHRMEYTARSYGIYTK
jgi:hypothetical protein